MTPFSVRDDLAGLRALAVAARLGGEVDDHRAVAHVGDGLGGDQLRRGAAGDERGGDDDVGAGDLDLQRLALVRLLLLGELAGVAGLGGRVGHALDLEELRAQRLDLLLDGGADVEGGHDRAEAAGGGDRLQAGDAGAEHEHLGGLDRARGGHQHREEARELLGGGEDGEVAGDGGLAGERVHRLGARDARDLLHREGGDAAARRGARRPRGRSAARGSRSARVPCASLPLSSADGRRDLEDGVGLVRGRRWWRRPRRRGRRAARRSAPAPASITTSWPCCASLRTMSGTSATRRSPGAVSVGTPIRKGREPYPNV